jgi:hypothetical protein
MKQVKSWPVAKLERELLELQQKFVLLPSYGKASQEYLVEDYLGDYMVSSSQPVLSYFESDGEIQKQKRKSHE